MRDLRCGSHEDQEDVHFGDNDDVTIPFVTLLAAEFVAMVSTMALVLWLLALLFVVIADIFVVVVDDHSGDLVGLLLRLRRMFEDDEDADRDAEDEDESTKDCDDEGCR